MGDLHASTRSEDREQNSARPVTHLCECSSACWAVKRSIVPELLQKKVLTKWRKGPGISVIIRRWHPM